MKKLLLFIGLIIPILLSSQTYEIPKGYEADFAAATEKVSILKSAGFDYVLDPIEQVAIEPTAFELQTGNWANDHHGTTEYNSYMNYSRTVAVFIHDTAGKLEHEFLKAAHNELGEVFTGESSPRDGHSHGTHVAGCVGGAGYSAPLGVAGDMAEKEYLWLIPHKCLSNSGSGYHSWIARSIRRAVEKGKLLQNQGFFIEHVLSLGGGNPNQEVEDAIKEARAAGQLVFVAAGNSGGTPPAFPGRAEGSLCTAALQQSGSGVTRASYSQYGDQVYMSAAGSSILSTVPGGALKKYSGTSMATPTLAGMAAKLASHYASATAYQIEQMLGLHATPIGDAWNKYTGWGTPVLNKYLLKNINDYKNEPLKPGDGGGGNPPPDQDKEREKRDLLFTYVDYETLWRPLSANQFETIEVNLLVSFSSKLYDDQAYDIVKAANDKFFTNRAFVLRDEHGFVDASYWIRHFYEMIVNNDPSLKDKGIKVKVETIWGEDEEGRLSHHDRRWMQQLGGKLKRLSINSPMTMSTFSIP